MVWSVLSFQESFDNFSYKRANLTWSDSALFSLLKNKVAIFSFNQNKSFDQKAIQSDPYEPFVQKVIWFDLCNSVFEEDSEYF